MAPIPWARARLPIARVAKADSSVASASLRYFAINFGLLRYLAASKAGPLDIGQPPSQLFPLRLQPHSAACYGSRAKDSGLTWGGLTPLSALGIDPSERGLAGENLHPRPLLKSCPQISLEP